jgi:hypothetical protein
MVTPERATPFLVTTPLIEYVLRTAVKFRVAFAVKVPDREAGVTVKPTFEAVTVY